MGHLSASDVTAIFLSLGVLLISARTLGEICRRLGQPPVVGEILAGVLLGPTVLGRFAPGLAERLLPIEGNAGVVLDGITTISISLFLLVAGMEVELSTVWRRGRTALGVSLAGFLIPFSVGLVVAWLAPYSLGCELDANPRIFALFFGTAISISALPVIAKTLMDLQLYRSDFGMIVIAAAVFNDLLGWLVFAVILGLLGTDAAHGYGVAGTVALTIAVSVLVMTVGRWAVHRALPWVQAYTSWPGGVLGFAMSLALLAASLTEWIGIHAIFGAFLIGVAFGDSPHLRPETRRTILEFVSFIFAPLFFASIGLRVDFAEKFYPMVILPVLVVGCLTKILGCGLTARLTGLDWNASWAIGFALNARGAMEIILGLLALNNELIRQRMFVALVILALVTSMMSGPGIQRFLGLRRRSRLVNYLVPRGFRPRLAADSVPRAVAELCEGLVRAGHISRDLADALSDCDRVMPLQHHGKAAILHAAVPDLLRPLLTAGISQDGLIPATLDGQPTYLLCLFLTPVSAGDIDHLEQELAETLSDAPVVNDLVRAASYTEFVAILQMRRSNEPGPTLVSV